MLLIHDRVFSAGLVLLFGLAISGPASAAAAGQEELAWQPAKTRVFIASLCWYKGQTKPDFALDERLDGALADVFRKAGVPKEQIVVLLDGRATKENIQKEFTRAMQASKPGELLIFYFGGHGTRGSFSTYDDDLPQTWVFDAIEKDYQGSRALLFADCCNSGGIVELAPTRKTAIGYACLSSTFSQQLGWSGWRFAQCLLRGFEGNPVVDLNSDGTIDLDELARYSERYMAFTAEGKPMFAVTGGFSSKMRLATARGKRNDRVGELVEVWWENKWYKAEILAATSQGFKIHYTADTKTEWDSVVPKNYIRPFQFTRFKVGDRVEIQGGSDRQWYPGEVLATYESLCLCRYDGYAAEYDEWFGPQRMRKGN